MKLHQLDLFGTIRERVTIAQRTVKHAAEQALALDERKRLWTLVRVDAGEEGWTM